MYVHTGETSTAKYFELFRVYALYSGASDIWTPDIWAIQVTDDFIW